VRWTRTGDVANVFVDGSGAVTFEASDAIDGHPPASPTARRCLCSATAAPSP